MIGPVHFIDNKYRRWYFQIVMASRSRSTVHTYTERHHIYPKCFGGRYETNSDTTTALTAREHFLCHWLLTKCVAGQWKIKALHAFARMSADCRGNRQLSGWQYEKLRKANAQASSLRVRTSDERARLSRAKTGRVTPQHVRDKISKTKKGKKLLLDSVSRLRMSEVRKGIPKTLETRRKMSEHEKTDTHKANLSLGAKKRWQNNPMISVICEHCFTKAIKSNYVRWHGDNCRQKEVI